MKRDQSNGEIELSLHQGGANSRKVDPTFAKFAAWRNVRFRQFDPFSKKRNVAERTSWVPRAECVALRVQRSATQKNIIFRREKPRKYRQISRILSGSEVYRVHSELLTLSRRLNLDFEGNNTMLPNLAI